MSNNSHTTTSTSIAPTTTQAAGAPKNLGFVSRCTPSNLTVNCNSKDREQVVSGIDGALIEGCVFINCPHVLVRSKITFKDVTFINSTSARGIFISGGAMYVQENTAILNSSFIGCIANNTPSDQSL